MNARAEFYRLLEAGAPRRELRRVARRAFADEPVRRDRWLGALRRGHRIGISSFPAEIFVGADLEDLDRLRAARSPADL